MNQPSDRKSRRPKQATRILVALTLVGSAVFFGSVGLIAWLVASERSGDVKEGSFLAIELSGEISDAPLVGGLVLEPEKAPPVLTDIAWAIREAKDDGRILGIHLTLTEPIVGWAGYRELRDALAEFREAGKPCVAYSDSYTTGPYYLASACDRVALAPGGLALVNGLATSVTYYAGAFEKIGVQAQMLHVGDFKSAVEPYERTGPSEPASLAMDQMLDSLWAEFVSGVAASRGKTPEELQALVERPPMSAGDALAAGLVDVLVYPDQLRARAHEVGREGWEASLAAAVTDAPEDVDERYTTLREYLKGVRAAHDDGDAKIAIVYAEGPIVPGELDGGLFGGQMLTDRSFAEWFEEIRADDAVKAVVLRVDSPGGSGLASDHMWHAIRSAQADGLPVVVSMGNYAASGGYYIAAPADWIVAHPNTLTGSIGVFGGKLVFGGTYEKLGLSETRWERGSQADLLSLTSPFDEQGREVFQGFLDDFYEQFLGIVAEGRELDRDAVHAVAQGRVWTGEQALERKLVDELGGLDEALAKAAELAGIAEYGVERWPKQKGFFDLLMEDLEDQGAVRVELPGLDTDVLEDALLLRRVLGVAGVAALLPGNLTVTE